jgi:poly(hydroxyalkanoate) granule-associated protein
MKKPETSPFEDLRTATRKIWLAGLGALAEAEKRGDELFQTLVKSGEKYEPTLTEPMGKAGETVRESMKAAATKASSTFRELETALDRQVGAAMKRVGLASRDEIDSLKREVARLRKTVEEARASARPRAKKRAAKKATRAR